MKSKRILGAISIIAMVAILLLTAVVKTKNKQAKLTPEMKRTMQYEELSDEAQKADPNGYVLFGAYFAEDTDGDGEANKVLGSCRRVGDTNTLRLDLSVKGKGYLEGGKITITNQNFRNRMQVLKDSVLKQNYISDNVREIEFNNVNAGTNEFLTGIISAAISNPNDYTKTVSVRLTGNHVWFPDPNNLEEKIVTPIDKTINLTIDWYGTARADVSGEYKEVFIEEYNKNYIERVSTYEEKERPINFTVTTRETNRELIVKKNVVTVKFPALYGYYPTRVSAIGGVYDNESHTLTITTNSSNANNELNITVLYPQEAYNLLKPYDTITMPVTSYYEAYNNSNAEFTNPYITNRATSTATIYFDITTPPQGYDYKINVSILNKELINRENYISKRELIDSYSAETDDDVENTKYTVEWLLDLNSMSAPGRNDYVIKSNDNDGADLIDGISMADYISNTGIYFKNNNVVPEGGSVVIYDNNSGELIKEFSYADLSAYTESNPFYYDEPVANVRAEVRKVYNYENICDVETDNSWIRVHPWVGDSYALYFSTPGMESAGINEQNAAKIYDPDNNLIEELSYEQMLQYNSLTDGYVCDKNMHVEITGPRYVNVTFKNLDTIPQNISAVVYNENTKESYKTFSHNEMEQYNSDSEQGEIYQILVPEGALVGVKFYSSPSTIRNLKICHIREIDSKKVKEDYNIDEANNMSLLKTNVIARANDEQGGMVDDDSALLMNSVNLTELTVTSKRIDALSPDPVSRNISIYVPETGLSREWKNGVFLVKIPSQIIGFNVNNVTISNPNVQIAGYDVYKSGDNYFVKIVTNNEIPTKGFRIELSTNMLLNPMAGGGTIPFELYSYNEAHSVYAQPENDIYDINGNDNTQEQVGHAITYMDVLAPTSFSTIQYISDYDDNGSIAVAPNIAEAITGRTSAKVNIDFANYYGGKVDNVVILGRVPAEGSLGSEYTTTMTNDGITVPSSLENRTTVYYSENSDATKDLSDVNNGWTTKENTNFANVKAYLIVIENTEVPSGDAYHFEYNIQIPTNAPLNAIAYGNHIVYFNLYVEDGSILPRELSPNKVGIRAVKYYDIDIEKVKEGMIKPVPGATYQLSEINEVEIPNELNRILVSNPQGKIQLSNLRVNQEYSFKEILAPNEYELNGSDIKFKAVPDEEHGGLKIVYTSDVTFGPSATFVCDGTKCSLTAIVDDSPKLELIINKIDGSNENSPLSNVIFQIDNKNYVTKNGKINVKNLSLGVPHTVRETYADGYFLIPEFTFTLNKDEQNNLSITSDNVEFAGANITNTDEEDLIKVEATLTNYQIETYKLQIEKISETNQDAKLQNAKFLLKREDLNNSVYLTTNENGLAESEGLYVYEEGRSITGRYVLSEEEAPVGFVNNKEEIAFVVSKDSNEKLQIAIENENNLTTYSRAEIDDENKIVKLIIKDKPLFKVTKTDVQTGNPLQNVGFVIYELDNNGSIVDFAKDPNGNYIGTQNENGYYVIYTDENGEITAPLRNGTYKIIEVEFLEGYKAVDNSEVFKVSGNEIENHYVPMDHVGPQDPGVEPTITTSLDVEISSIEGWIRFTNIVKQNSGRPMNVFLTRDLDFNDTRAYADGGSYENPDDTEEFGDINGDGVVEGVKKEVTTGAGCPSAGSYENYSGNRNYFQGIFDGRGHKIENIYMNRPSTDTVGLFGCTTGQISIKNLTITGSITGNNYVGGIVGTIDGGNAYFYNINNKANINNGFVGVGGIVGYTQSNARVVIKECNNYGELDGSTNGGTGHGGLIGYVYTGFAIIKNSNNYGDVLSTQETGGIIGYTHGGATILIEDTCNKGNVESSYSQMGGIIGADFTSTYIRRCHNEGTITCTGSGTYVGGIIGRFSASGAVITDTYNKGTINTLNSEGGAGVGGIIGNTDGNSANTLTVANCYNEGNINIKGGAAAGICGGYTSATIVNCYNTGNITSSSANSYSYIYLGGIASRGPNSEISYCYNTGSIKTENNGYDSYVTGITVEATSINNSYNLGNLTVKTISSNSQYVSGIAHNVRNLANLNNCYNKGALYLENIGNSNPYAYVNGIEYSYNSSSTDALVYCYNMGDITVKKCNYPYVNGVTQARTVHCYNTGDINIENCNNSTYVTGVSYNSSAWCHNSGNITITNPKADVNVSGVCTPTYYSNNSAEYCYNTGNISVTGLVSSNNSYISGICRGNATNCYNTGNIYCKYGETSNTHYTNIGGIAATSGTGGRIANCYNTGNITLEDDNNVAAYTYIGGIVAEGSSAPVTIEKCYSTGDIIDKSVSTTGNLRDGAIYGIQNSNPVDVYYLASTTLLSRGLIDETQYAVSDAELKSDEIYQTLKAGSVDWMKIENGYPRLNLANASTSQEMTEINFTNEKEIYDITTEIGLNNNGERAGGTITGEYTDKYFEGSNRKHVQTANYGDTLSRDIEIRPSEDYVISTIKINGENEAFTANDDGSYIIPASRFGTINKNYHIVVVFNEKSRQLNIKKEDEDGNPIEGVEFSINQVETRAEIGEEIKAKVDSEAVAVPDYTKDVTSGKIGSLVNDQFKFVDIGGAYKSNNTTQSYSVAHSYFEVDLTGSNYQSGTYQIIVNAENVLSTGSIYVTESTDKPSGSENRIASISSTTASKNYKSGLLVGGKKYYVHAIYDKGNQVAEGYLKINSIKVGKLDSGTNYGDLYVQGVRYSTVGDSTTINLSGNPNGNYVLSAKAASFGYTTSDRAFLTVTAATQTTVPSYSTTAGRFAVMQGTVGEQEYTYSLDGGSNYKLWLGYYRSGYSDSYTYSAYAAPIKLYAVNELSDNSIVTGPITPDLGYKFIDNGNGTYSTQVAASGKSYIMAHIPINLTGFTGNYRVAIEADVNNTSTHYAYAIIDKDENSLPGYTTTAGRAVYQSGNTNETYYSEEIAGGDTYYLHVGYYCAGNGNSKFDINSIKIYETTDKVLKFDEITEGNGNKKYVSNNQGYANTTAHSYIPINLENTYGKYNLTVNAEISSQAKDHGYVFVSETTDMPAITASGKLIDVSGTVAAADYFTTLDAGQTYYLHLLYNKDLSGDAGTDTFTINSITLEYNQDDFYHEDGIKTDAAGKIVRIVNNGTYEITETKAVDGFTPLTEPVRHTVTSTSNNNVTITNYRNRTITTHYLVNGTGPEFGKDAVELDDIKVQHKNIGEEYTTPVQIQIDGYSLLKDSNDEYIIPANARGTVGTEDIDVYYYYDLIKYPYEIHYFYDNVEDEDELITGNEVPGVEITFTDKAKDGYAFDKATNAPLIISTHDDENIINVYYSRILNIRTDVIEHTETKHDGATDNVKGGSISGEDEDPYETVQIGMANLLPIVIEPDAGYEIKEVRINGDVYDVSELLGEDGIVTFPELYFRDMQESKNITVEFKKRSDVKVRYMIKDTQTSLYTDEETGNKYIQFNGYAGDEFTAQAKNFVGYKPAQKFVTDQDGTEITTNIDGEVNGTMYADELVVTYWYDIDNSTVREEHILINEDSTTQTLPGTQNHTGQVGTTETLNRRNFGYYKAKNGPESQDENVTVAGKDDTSVELTYTSGVTKTVRFYYERKEGKVTVHYMDAEKVAEIENPTRPNGDAIENPTVLPGYAERSYSTTAETIAGYTLDETQLPGNASGEYTDGNIDVYYYYIENSYPYTINYIADDQVQPLDVVTGEAKAGTTINYEEKTFPDYEFDHADKERLVISANEQENVLNVYYTRAEETVIEKHILVDNGTDTPLSETPHTQKVGTNITLHRMDDIRYVSAEGPASQDTSIIIVPVTDNDATVTFEQNTPKEVRFYYTRRAAQVIVRYLESDGTLIANPVAPDDTPISNPYTEVGYVGKGYNFSPVSIKEYTYDSSRAPTNAQGEMGINPITVDFYYKQNKYPYEINYYLDGVKKADETVTGEATLGTEIPYTQKTFTKYVFDHADKEKIVISSVAGSNVLNVYYVSLLDITTSIDEHDEHYKNGTTVQDVKGGTISGEDETPFETVKKGVTTASELQPVVITPDEGYEIESVKVNNVPYNFAAIQAQDGSVTFTADYLKDITTDTHIEVKFRKLSSVKVRYLNKQTGVSLYKDDQDREYVQIDGYEGKEFTAPSKSFEGYVAANPALTDENGTAVEATGTMYADQLTLTYWYERAETTVIEEHIDITTGTEVPISEDSHTGTSWTNITLNRLTDEKYLPADGPASTEENVIVVASTENSKEVQFVPEVTKTVKFYYVRKDAKVIVNYKDSATENLIVNPVRPDNTAITNPYELNGKVGDHYEVFAEEIKEYTLDTTRMPTETEGDMKLTPITIDFYYNLNKYPYEINYYLDGVKKADETVTGTAPLSAEIPYEQKTFTGYAFDHADKEKIVISSTAGENVLNVYYVSELKITTAIEEHDEHFKDGTVTPDVKGGTISGEDENPFETVKKGVTTAEELDPVVITPAEGYEIESIKVNGTAYNFNDKLAQDGSVTFTAEYLKDITVDTHIEAKFRKLSKVIVKHLIRIGPEVYSLYRDDDGNEFIQIDGYEGKPYETESLQLERYVAGLPVDEEGNLVPASGNMYADDLTVIYWYTEKSEPRPPVFTTLTVEYRNSLTGDLIENPVTPDGTAVENPKEISAEVGKTYNVTEYRKAIKGYRLDETKLPEETGTVSGPKTITYQYIELKDYDVQVVYKLDGTPIETVKVKATSDSGVNIENYTTGGKLVIDNIESTEEGTIIYTIIETETPDGLKTILPESNPGKVTVKKVFNEEANKYEIQTETNGIEGLHVDVNDEDGTITIYVDAKEKEKPVPEPTPIPQPEPKKEEPKPSFLPQTGDFVIIYIVVAIVAVAGVVIAIIIAKKKKD